jgi:hypothetical protein
MAPRARVIGGSVLPGAPQSSSDLTGGGSILSDSGSGFPGGGSVLYGSVDLTPDGGGVDQMSSLVGSKTGSPAGFRLFYFLIHY